MSSQSMQLRLLQDASADYQKLQADLSNIIEARQRLDAQRSENELVKKASGIPSSVHMHRSDRIFRNLHN